MLALNEKLLAAVVARFREHEIDATIGATTTGFDNMVALQPEALAHEHLEFAPAHAIECVGRLALRHVGDEVLPCPASPGRHPGAAEAEDWNDVLADAGQRLPKGLRDHRANLARLGGGDHLLRCDAVQQ